MVEIDGGSTCLGGGFLQSFAELSNVVGPRVVLEVGEGFGGEGWVIGNVLEESCGYGGNVLWPGAEGWEGDLGGGDAAVELVAKLAGGCEGAEFTVAGSNDPEVATLDVRLMEEVDEAGLEGEGNAVDLVEEEGAAVGFAEDVGGGRVRKETVDELGGVPGDEWAVVAGAALMEGMGEGLLAGAGFSGDEGDAEVGGNALKL